jgi:YHS domain-containing protein
MTTVQTGELVMSPLCRATFAAAGLTLVCLALAGCGGRVKDQPPATPVEQPATQPAEQPPAMPAPTEEGGTEEVTPYPLDTCIVSGEELGSMGDPVRIVHEGQEIKFCCKACVAKFKEDPAKYLQMIHEKAGGDSGE